MVDNIIYINFCEFKEGRRVRNKLTYLLGIDQLNIMNGFLQDCLTMYKKLDKRQYWQNIISIVVEPLREPYQNKYNFILIVRARLKLSNEDTYILMYNLAEEILEIDNIIYGVDEHNYFAIYESVDV